MSDHFEMLCDHLRPFAGSAQIRELRWPEGPILRSQPEFRVACIVRRGWLPGSRCDHLLVSLPYPYGPKLEEIGPANRLLWLLPITRDEAAFGRGHGIEALEQCFEREQLDYLDPARDSVALAPPRGGLV